MRTLKTSEAAALLNVSPNTLRAWEQRFGYPRPQRSPGRHRLYAFAEIEVLRGALREGLSISSAVSVARESVSTDVLALVSAISSFKGPRADLVMETSLAMGSIEHAVEDLLLQALAYLYRRKGPNSASWNFGSSWATDWLRRAQRLVAAPECHGAVLIGEASADPSDECAPNVRALELFCARAGLEPLSLPVRALGALHEAVAALRPDVLVIAGPDNSRDVGRWIYGVRSVAGAKPIAYFQRFASCASMPSAMLLAQSPSRAQQELAALAASTHRTYAGAERSGSKRFSSVPVSSTPLAG